MRAGPGDVDTEAGIWLVKNAKNEPAHTITLNASQVAAWQAFIAADAWGEFDTTKYGRLIHEAGWPKAIRPYAARHSVAMDAIRRGVNLGDVQALLGHATPDTTRRSYAPFVLERQSEVSAALSDRLASVFKLRGVK